MFHVMHEMHSLIFFLLSLKKSLTLSSAKVMFGILREKKYMGDGGYKKSYIHVGFFFQSDAINTSFS